MTHWTETFFVDNAELFASELEAIDGHAEIETEHLRTLLADEFDSTPTTVLDVGCGIGRHSLEFAEAGFDVTGIDISPEYIKRARERTDTDAFEGRVEFQELDMRNLDTIEKTYELVVCLYNTFGYFDDETNVEILRSMRRRLTEDGVCVIQVGNKDTALTSLDSASVRELEFGMVVNRHEFDTETSRMTITRDVLQGTHPNLTYEGRVEYTVRQYSPPELERVFRRAGFDEVALFGGYDGTAPSLDTPHLVVLAR